MQDKSEGSGIPWEKWAAVTVVALGAFLAVWFFFRFLFGILLPVFLGAGLVALLRPLSEKLRGKTGIPGAVVSLFAVLLVGGGLVVLFGFAIRRLLSEASALLLRVTEEGFAVRLEELAREFLSRIPFLAEGLGEEFSVASLIGAGIGRLGEARPGFLAGVVSFLPGAVFSVIVFLFSAFYFAVDGERIRGSVTRFLPASLHAKLRERGARTASAAASYGQV